MTNSDATALNPGDIVTLKSGGPAMTVEKLLEPRGLVLCIWFDRDGEVRFKELSSATLERVDRVERAADAPPVGSVRVASDAILALLDGQGLAAMRLVQEQIEGAKAEGSSLPAPGVTG